MSFGKFRKLIGGRRSNIVIKPYTEEHRRKAEEKICKILPRVLTVKGHN